MRTLTRRAAVSRAASPPHSLLPRSRHNSTWTVAPPAAAAAQPVAPPAAAIDMHSHFLPKSWPCLASRYGGEGWPSMRHSGQLPTGTFGYDRSCGAMLMSGGEDFRPVTSASSK